MKLIALTAIVALTGIANAAYSANLQSLYGYVCESNAQKANLVYDATTNPPSYTSGSTLYTDNSIYQILTGFALGTQVEQNVTDSTCFGQAW